MIIECIMFNQPQRIIESGYVVALAISVDPSVEFFKAIYHYATKHSIPIRKKMERFYKLFDSQWYESNDNGGFDDCALEVQNYEVPMLQVKVV